jgi:hypothetical protein
VLYIIPSDFCIDDDNIRGDECDKLFDENDELVEGEV